MRRSGRLFLSLGIAGVIGLAPGIAAATDGYFLHGLGAKAKAMGGAGIALPQDAMAIATNPATATELGHRLDIGFDLFLPDREAVTRGTASGINRRYDGNATDLFAMGDIAYVRPVSGRFAVGLALYASGGLNTDYRGNPYETFGATGNAGSDLKQGFIVPTVAFRIAEGHSIGVSAVGVVQSLEVEGIGGFAGFSTDPENFSDRGTGISHGGGFKLGYFGRLGDRFAIGAYYQSKLETTGFDRYAGMLAGGGGFDVPATWGAGIAVRATGRLTFAGDIRRIDYAGVESVGNASARLRSGWLYGSEGGPGFGWRSITVYKIGAQYAATERLTLRAGFGLSENPVPRAETMMNALAQGVVEEHYTIGATWAQNDRIEISAYAMHAPRKTVRGRGSIPADFGGGEMDVSLAETSLGLSLGLRF